MQPPTLTPHVLDSSRLQTENVTPALYRELLKNAQDCLWAKFEAGESVRLLVEARTEAIDIVLTHAWQSFGLSNENELALLAVGGYGRGELHLASDIDVLVLHGHGQLPDTLKESISRFITLLWDLGLEVGSSVRSLSECVESVSEDVTIATNVLEVRTLCGNDELRQTLLALIRPLWTDAAFFEATPI